ncbi:MAG: hypothetical protein LBJ74_01360 [Heliobacteriaceae bacterium]|jgi:hypothetical protein|nr:hypothetical protein [Heliobacteriaceae bacterium]
MTRVEPSFKGTGFYNFSADFEKNVLMNRAAIAGVNDVLWVVKANNNVERREKARRFMVAFTLSFLAPILTLPLSNRIGMKTAKLTKGFWSQNHKAAHISYGDLGSVDKMQKGLEKLKTKYTFNPIERLIAKAQGKKLEKTPLDFDELLEKCGNDPEKLRRKLINTKAGIISVDVVLSALPFGSIGFVNNRITKKQSGQSGFSAEMNMADKELVEKRAENYEKNWKKRYAGFVVCVAAMAAAMPLMLRGGLLSKNPNALFKRKAHKFDFEKGIYMSRLSLLLYGALLGHFGNFLATRNQTELKENLLRYGMADAVFLGGDLLLASAFMSLTDKFAGTKLTKPAKNAFQKILPDYKSIEEIGEDVTKGLAKAKDKKIRLGIYWLNLALITLACGIGIPTLMNALIRRDVEKAKRELIPQFACLPGCSFDDFVKKLV